MLTMNTSINLDGDGRQEVSRLAAEFDPHNLEDTTLTWLFTLPRRKYDVTFKVGIFI